MSRTKQSSDISIYAAVLTIFSILILFTISIKAQNVPAQNAPLQSAPIQSAPAQNAPVPMTENHNAPREKPETLTEQKSIIKKQTESGHQPKKPHKVLIIIIDDVGYNLFQLEPFLQFPGPISFAILPSLDYTQKAETLIYKAGKEILLHQPMEAIGNLDAGPGAIVSTMDDATIQRVIADNLAQLPLARGVNNHMGSLISQDERIMARVLDECRKTGLYYLDSVTIGNSVARKVARSMHFRIMERTVFLDNNPDKPSIQKQIREAADIAEKRGYAVMIGHVWSNELAQTLIELYPHLIESGFNFSTISDFLMEFDDDEFDIGD